MNSVTYRVATLADRATVVLLLRELVEELGPPEMSNRVIPRLDADIDSAFQTPRVRIFIAEYDGMPIGLSRADILTEDPIFRLRDDNRCGYVDQMYVRANHRDRGVGRELLHLCEDWFRDNHIGHAILHAAPRAVRFYSRDGYQPNREMFKSL